MAVKSGRTELDQHIAQWQENNPGFSFKVTSEIEAHNYLIFYSWQMCDADGNSLLPGKDMLELNDEGKISRVTGWVPGINAFGGWDE